jgi:O-antigen/teichoic acid export membrane protein
MIQNNNTHQTSQKKEVTYNVLVNLLLQIVSIVCGFILPPLIVQTFGSNINGMVSSIKQFIAYLSIVEAGIGGASIAMLYKPLAENNIKFRNEILSATRYFYNKSGFLFTGLIIIFAFIYPFIIRSQENNNLSRLMVLILGISGVSDFFLIGKYRVLLIADRKNYVVVLIHSMEIISNTVISILLIKLFNVSSIITMQLMVSFSFLLRYILIVSYIKRNYRDLYIFNLPNTNILQQKWDVLVHQISGLIVFNSPIVLLSIFCDLNTVSIYTVYSMVFSSLGSLIGCISNGIQAVFGKLLIEKRIDSIYQKYETMYFIILGWAYSCAYILTIPFMKLYTKNMVDAEYVQPTLTTLFVAVGIANNLRVPANLLITAAGHFKQTKNRAILEAVVNIIASLFFVIKYGLNGILIGSACSFLYRTVDMIVYSHSNILNTRIVYIIGKIILWGLCYFIVAYVVIRIVPYSGISYFGWIKYAFTVVIILAVPGIGYILSRFRLLFFQNI